MNTSGISYGQRSKQLPTPVVLTDTFIDHKKTQINSPNEQTKIDTPFKFKLNNTSIGESSNDKITSPSQLLSNEYIYQTKNVSLKSLNTPVALRSVPYKRYRNVNQSKPLNLSKNGIL